MHGPGRITRAARRRLALVLALAAGASLAPAALPGAAPAVAAVECRQEVTGEDLPDNAGALPLINQLGLRQAWDLSTGRGVTVAVVDSGVDASHPDLEDAVGGGSEFAHVTTEEEFERITPAPHEDCSGHGTAVAGLIAADRAEGDRMAGVAPDARVHPVRLADGADQASENMLAAAIDDAVDSGAGVLNLSFAVPVDREPIREAVERALAEDLVVVAASGNEGNENTSAGRMYPAAYPGVLAVGAVDNQGQPMDASNAGEWLDLAGYGEELPVVAPGGSGYRVEAGTSFAAAQVSGAAALVRARFPDLPAEEIAARLTGAAAPVGGGRNDRTGFGVVDPFGALTHLGPDDAADGGGGEASDDAAAGSITVQPVPEDEPLLGPVARTAVAWSGGLLLAVALGLVAAPAIRRGARRGWHPGPDAPGDRAASRPAPRPAQRALSRLDGSDTPPTTGDTASQNLASPHRKRI